MSSRGPAMNLRPISRSAATAFSLGPGEPACELVRLPDPAAVSQTRQAQAPPPVWRHSPHPSLCPVLSGSSTSAASRLQPAEPDCVPRPSPSRASHVILGCLYRHIMCCPPELSKAQTQQRPHARVVCFPQAHRPSVLRLSVPLAHGPSVSHNAAVSFAPSESVPRSSQAISPLDLQNFERLTGRQCPKRLVSRHPSQFPVAHRPSLVTPCLDDGVAAVPAPGRATSVLASGPLESCVRVPGPLARLSLVTGLRPPSTRPGPRQAKRPPPHHRVCLEPIPTRASDTGATSTGQQSGVSHASSEP
jgi:hypothetical protein